MSSNQVVSVLVNNDITLTLQLTKQIYPNTALTNYTPLNLTGLSLTFYIKAASTAADSGATTYTIGSGITVTNAALGQITVTIPKSANATAGLFWWRIDVISGASVSTAMYGPYYVLSV